MERHFLNKSKNSVYEFETIMYSTDDIQWIWNSRNNLEGISRDSGLHKFTWQPHGSQFTIIEEVPDDSLLISIQPPPEIDHESILSAVGFKDDWITVRLKSSG